MIIGKALNKRCRFSKKCYINIEDKEELTSSRNKQLLLELSVVSRFQASIEYINQRYLRNFQLRLEMEDV